MSGRQSGPARRPATKQPHLQKKLQKQKGPPPGGARRPGSRPPREK